MGYYRKEEKGMKKFVALLLVLVMAFPMQGYASEPESAEVFEKDGFSYTINEDGNSVTISRYNGNGGDVVIPSEIDGKNVTGIGVAAFRECRNLTNVTIPDRVTSIGSGAFLGCNNLKSCNDLYREASDYRKLKREVYFAEVSVKYAFNLTKEDRKHG